MELNAPQNTADSIYDELERLSYSPQLVRSKRLLRFLRFTVEQTLNQQSESLSEYTIGRQVYDRKEDFDPAFDGIVRAEAHRLRAKLREYYLTDARQDTVVIEYPIGSYVPVFRRWSPEFLPTEGKMADVIRARDWSTSPLGPINTWSRALKASLSIHLRSSFAAAICWGPEFILLYNDAMHVIAGGGNPDLFGRPLAEVDSNNWSVLGPTVQRIRDTGESIRWEKTLWLQDRPGYRLESYFTTSFSAIPEANGEPGGVLVQTMAMTDGVLYERRNKTIVELSALANEVRGIDETCRAAASVLGRNPYDIPFASIYLTNPAGTGAEFQAGSGINPGTAVSPNVIPLRGSGPLSIPIKSARQEVLEVGGQLGHLPTGAWEVAPREIVVLPLRLAWQAEPIGALIAGVNPHRPADEEYLRFFETIGKQISGLILRARTGEKERRDLAEVKRHELAWSGFVSEAAKEFRTPVTVILGLLDQMLVDSGLPARQRKQLLVARRNGLRLLNLMASLIDLISAQSGQLEPTFEAVNLGTSTEELARAFASALARADVHFVVDCPPLAEPAWVDRGMWDKLVLILLVNAVQLTEAGEVGISVRQVGPWIDTVVWDTGVGTPESEQERIFEPFHATGPELRRAGVSLMLVKQFAALHGGRVTLKSEVGKGSKFVVSIPRGRAHLPAERVTETGSRTSPTALKAYVADGLRWVPDQTFDDSMVTTEPNGDDANWRRRELVRRRRHRVLVAISDHDLRQYVKSLAGEIYNVETVADGDTALRALQERPPDLVFADSELRGLNGLGLVRAVRADSTLGSLPIVLTSSLASEKDRLRAVTAGATDYLVKPFTAAELLVHLESQIALAEINRRIGLGGKAPVNEIDSHWIIPEAALDQLPIGVIVVEMPSGEMIVKNRMIREMFGQVGENILRLEDIPDPFGRRADGTPRPRRECALVRAAEQGETVTDEVVIYDLPGGKPLNVMSSSCPIRGRNGNTIGAVVTYRAATS